MYNPSKIRKQHIQNANLQPNRGYVQVQEQIDERWSYVPADNSWG